MLFGFLISVFLESYTIYDINDCEQIVKAYYHLDNSIIYNNKLNNPFGGANGMSYEDLFAQMFGNQTQNPFAGRQNAVPDKIVKVQISPIESYKGVDKTIRYMKDNHCNLCNGSGGDYGENEEYNEAFQEVLEMADDIKNEMILGVLKTFKDNTPALGDMNHLIKKLSNRVTTYWMMFF